MNNKLERTVRIQKRILICLAVLTVLFAILLFVKDAGSRSSSVPPQDTVQQDAVPGADASPSANPAAAAPAGGL
jgi:hypothetical protein